MNLNSALLLLAACRGEPVPEAGDLSRIVTDPAKYPAAPTKIPRLADGYHGLVKISAEHGFRHDGKKAEVSFVAEGAGGLWVREGEWYVVTARHVVVPNPEILKIGDTEMEEVTATSVRIAVSSLGIEPASLRFLPDEDVAALLVAPKDRSALLSVYSPDAEAPLRSGGTEKIRPADAVEAWGFPATHHPQVNTPAISAVTDRYFVLNTALLRGYSGGPVLSRGEGARALVGIISRADEAAQQTTVLPWSAAAALFGERATKIQIPGEGTFTGLPLSIRSPTPAVLPPG